MNWKPNKSTYEITPQTRTRPPVVHLFWRYSILFGLFLGFPTGIYLWLFINRQVEREIDYFLLVNLHANVQLLLFFGLFILGFVYTAGFHLNGGKPQSFWKIVWLIPAMLMGFLFFLFPEKAMYGKALISLSFAYSGVLMFRAANEGNFPNIPVTVLTLLGLLTFTIAPWLDLTNLRSAFYVVLGGPVLFVLMAGLQLVPNIMKGNKLGKADGRIFSLIAFCGYVLLMTNVFGEPVPLSAICGLYMLAAVFYLVKVNIAKAIEHCGPTSLSVAFFFGFSWFFVSMILLLLFGEGFLGSIIHLLVLGQVTTHVIAVGSRVIGFFSGDYVIEEGYLVGMLLLWQVVPFTRGLDGFIDFPLWVSWVTAVVSGGIVLVWSNQMHHRIRKV